MPIQGFNRNYESGIITLNLKYVMMTVQYVDYIVKLHFHSTHEIDDINPTWLTHMPWTKKVAPKIQRFRYTRSQMFRLNFGILTTCCHTCYEPETYFFWVIQSPDDCFFFFFTPDSGAEGTEMRCGEIADVLKNNILEATSIMWTALGNWLP